MREDTTNRVLFVDQSGELGGAELSLMDILLRRPTGDRAMLFSDGPFAERLRNARFDVRVLPLDVDVSRSTGWLGQLRAGGSVLAAARRLANQARQFDLIYANTQKAAIVATVAARIAQRPFIWHLRDILCDAHFSQANRWAVTRATNLIADRVIANSEATAAAYREAGGRVAVDVVPNGIDPGPFDAARAKREQCRMAVRSELGIRDEPLLALFGRLSPWKGQHVAIEAVADLPDAHLLVAGGALFGEDGYATQLQELAIQLGLENRIHFLGFRDDIPTLMQAADVVLHCSTAPEPFGRVIVEGMLSARPVVASRAGGAIEIIEQGETGVLCDIDNAASLATSVRSVLELPGFAEQLAARAEKVARRRFHIDDCARQINAVINQVTAARAPQEVFAV